MRGRGDACRRAASAGPPRARPNDAPLDTEALRGERGHGLRDERARAGPGRNSPTTAMSAGCRATRSSTPGAAADAQGLGAPHVRLHRAGHQVAAARGAAARRARRRHRRGRGPERPLRADRAGGAVVVQHLAPLDAFEADWTAVAERFLGVPYLWGGKTSLGIDCSGLVQVALARLRHRRAARQRHAGGGRRPAAAARRRACRRSGAATWFSGRAMSASCATAKRCCTPTPTHMAVASRAACRRRSSGCSQRGVDGHVDPPACGGLAASP